MLACGCSQRTWRLATALTEPECARHRQPVLRATPRHRFAAVRLAYTAPVGQSGTQTQHKVFGSPLKCLGRSSAPFTRRFGPAPQASPEAPFLRIVANAARRYGIEPGTLRYGAALREVEHLASMYRTANLGPGCRIALLLGNRPDFFLHWLALNAVGVSVVPLNPDWGAAEAQYVLEHSGAVLAVAEAKRRKDLQNAAAHLPPAAEGCRFEDGSGWRLCKPLGQQVLPSIRPAG